MCGESLRLPLIMFQAALNDDVFTNDWKNGNALVHKKDLKIC